MPLFPAPLPALLAILLMSGCVGCSSSTPASSSQTAAPVLAVTPGSLAFGSTVAGQSSAAQTVTITNTGTSLLTLSGISVSDTADYAVTSNCPASLAGSASCTASVVFKPQSMASLPATLTVAGGGSTASQTVSQTVALTGTGIATPVQHTLLTFPEADSSVTPLYSLVNAAAKTIDLTMYELVDTTFSGDLLAACSRGVRVRVILDQSLEKSSNTAAYTQLNSAGANCSAAWSNLQFQATHEKSLVIDGTTAAILSLNLTSRYYTTTRDFALVTTDPADIAAIEATFNTDYGSTTDFSYQPGAGTDLIWSPTTAQPDLLALINGAQKTLLVENEEMGAANIVSALEAACGRGVQVEIAMTNQSSYATNFKALETAGCGVHVYPDTATALYIHAKAMVADYGLSTQQVYLGSINFSIASMTENRELGLYVSDPASVTALQTTMAQDYAGASAF